MGVNDLLGGGKLGGLHAMEGGILGVMGAPEIWGSLGTMVFTLIRLFEVRSRPNLSQTFHGYSILKNWRDVWFICIPPLILPT